MLKQLALLILSHHYAYTAETIVNMYDNILKQQISLSYSSARDVSR